MSFALPIFPWRSWLLGSICALLFATVAWAQETEIREFTVDVDGKQCGQNVMTITVQDDGVESVRNVAEVNVKHFFGTYRYSYQGTEHWKDGRVFQINAACNDDGTKTKLSATFDAGILRLDVNGRQRNCRGDVWTTSYWKIPPRQFHNQNIPLMDSDTGKEMVGQLKFVGQQMVMIAGNQQNCFHFRLTGGPSSPIDLWYDNTERLVRQEYTDQGKRVVVILRDLKRLPPVQKGS